MARTEPDVMGNPPFPAWAQAHPQVSVAPFADAAAGADLVVNATSGSASLPALEAAGAANLAGKVVLDISNPLDFSAGFPPTLFVKDTDSLAEQIQRAFPEAKVVKSLNTMTANLMVHPRQLAGGDHTVFVSGDDAEAKQTVTELLACVRPHRRPRPGRPVDRPGRRDVPAALAAAVRQARHPGVQRQGRPLSWISSQPPSGARSVGSVRRFIGLAIPR